MYPLGNNGTTQVGGGCGELRGDGNSIEEESWGSREVGWRRGAQVNTNQVVA